MRKGGAPNRAPPGGPALPHPQAEAQDSFGLARADATGPTVVGRVELGQGSVTGLLMIAAEELDLAMSQMKFLRNDTNVTPDQGTTAGSSAISGGGKQVRAAAAAARSALLDLAAAKLGIAKVLTNTYRYHYNGHLPIGPSCCVADVTTAGARIFSNTQNAYGTRSAVALVTGLPAERIRVSYYEGSSVYGSSPQTDVAQHVAARRQACAA